MKLMGKAGAVLSVAVMALGLMGFDWPEKLDWLKPRKAEPSAASQQKQADKVRQKRYEQDGWMMTIQTDGFTGKVRCHLFSPKTLTQGRITYAQNTFGFQMDEEESVLKAWYRADNKPARQAQDHYPQLVAERVAQGGGPLDNPTAGIVLIPYSEVLGAKVVTIRLDEDSSPKRFKLRGFEQALAAARYNGCTSDDTFERTSW